MFNTWYVYNTISSYLTIGSNEKKYQKFKIKKIKIAASSVNCSFRMNPAILHKDNDYSNWKYDLSI